MLNNDNVDTSTPSNGKEMIKQSELTGFTECGMFSSTTEARESVDGLVHESVMAWNGLLLDYDPFVDDLLDYVPSCIFGMLPTKPVTPW